MSGLWHLQHDADEVKQAPSCAGLQTFNSHGTSMISPSFADNELRKVSRSSLSGVITVSTVFSKDGRFIYMGQSKGFLSVLDANSLQFLDVLKVRIFACVPCLAPCSHGCCYTLMPCMVATIGACADVIARSQVFQLVLSSQQAHALQIYGMRCHADVSINRLGGACSCPRSRASCL